RGRLVAAGRVADLIGEGASTRSVRVRVAPEDVTIATSVLETGGLLVRREHDALLVDGAGDAAQVNRTLGERGVWVQELTPLHADLESVFLGLTQHETPGGHTHRGKRRKRGGPPPEPGHAAAPAARPEPTTEVAS